MHSHAAPVDRGPIRTWHTRLARLRFGRAAVLALALLGWTGATALCDSPVGASVPRQLLAAPSTTKPSFILPDLAGAPLDLRAQAGRIVLVHFFATWCEPCREELASLSRLTAGPRGARVAVLAVNVAEVPVRVRKFLDAAPVTFPVVLDGDRAVTRAWDVSILPTTFVLDRKLEARLFVEGDIDWQRPDIAAALDALDAEARN